MHKNIIYAVCILLASLMLAYVNKAFGQIIPDNCSVYSNMHFDKNKNAYSISTSKQLYFEKKHSALETLDKYRVYPTGNDTGIVFDFHDKTITGLMYYGFIGSNRQKFKEPVFYKDAAKIIQGVAVIDIRHKLDAEYDFVGWQNSGMFSLGYRIVNSAGIIMYDGKIDISGKGPFETAVSIVEGPFINNVTESGAVISFTTNTKTNTRVFINNQFFTGKTVKETSEIAVAGLQPDSSYLYTVYYGNRHDSYTLKTNPAPGSRNPFTFCFASDSRYGAGGGERNIYGTNAYIMKKIAALAVFKKASFLQFSGDMIDGYNYNYAESDLQFSNWKRAVEPFSHLFPINTAMGNHEIISTLFKDSLGKKIEVDKFPFDRESAEFAFSKNFVNPENGPYSEDSSAYDPDDKRIDFPSYKESVYYYTFGNAGFIILNGDYWYSNTTFKIPVSGGNPHGYIMDNQLKWLKKVVGKLESDNNIDHIFVSIHTPPFPNGGHSIDDMWYKGNNDIRPYIAGKPVAKGIIERRDEFLDIIVNNSKKVVALLCGDEHNYSRMKINTNGNYYPEKYPFSKLQLTRAIWQVTDGAAGAPYYAQEQMPWSDNVEFFSTQYALVFFNINGNHVTLETYNPDTLEKIEEIKLK